MSLISSVRGAWYTTRGSSSSSSNSNSNSNSDRAQHNRIIDGTTVSRGAHRTEVRLEDQTQMKTVKILATRKEADTNHIISKIYLLQSRCLRRPPLAILWPLRQFSALDCRRGTYFFKIDLWTALFFSFFPFSLLLHPRT